MKRAFEKSLGVLILSGAAASLAPWSGSDWETIRPWSSILAPSQASAQGVVASDEEAPAELPIAADDESSEPMEGPPGPVASLESAPMETPEPPALLLPTESELTSTDPNDKSPTIAPSLEQHQPLATQAADEPLETEPAMLPGDVPVPSLESSIPAADEAPTQHDHAAATVMVDWISPKSISRGRETEFKLLVRNTMKHAAKNVAVHVQLPEHAELGKCNPAPTPTDDVLMWKIGQLAPGATRTISLGITPLERGEIEPQAAVTFTRASSTRVMIVEPELSLSINSSPRAVVGQRGGCVLVVHNGGNGPAAGVIVSAKLPAALLPTTTEEAKYQLGTLPPGESREIEFPLHAHKLGQHELEFQVTCLGAEPASIQHRLEVVQPTVQVAVEGPKLRYVERQANYVIRLENPGPAPINNVQVIENVPAGFQFVEATAGGDYDSEARQVAWFVGRLEPNAATTVEVKLIPAELGEHTVTTEVTADAGVTATAHATTRVEGVSSVVLEVVDRDDPIEVAGETMYEIRVTNQGTRPAAGVQVAASVPKEMEALELDGPSEGVIEDDKIVFEPIAELAPGKTETYRIHVRCNGEGNVRFRAYFRTDESANPVLEEELTHIYAD